MVFLCFFGTLKIVNASSCPYIFRELAKRLYESLCTYRFCCCCCCLCVCVCVCVFWLFGFLGPYLQYMEILRLGVKSDLELPAYTTTMPHLSHICHLFHRSWQCQILNPLSEVRDETCVLMDTNWVCYH